MQIVIPLMKVILTCVNPNIYLARKHHAVAVNMNLYDWFNKNLFLCRRIWIGSLSIRREFTILWCT